MHQKPYVFIGVGDFHGQNPYVLIGFWEQLHASALYIFDCCANLKSVVLVLGDLRSPQNKQTKIALVRTAAGWRKKNAKRQGISVPHEKVSLLPTCSQKTYGICNAQAMS